VLKKIP